MNESDLLVAFGANLRRLRNEKKITQVELSQLAELDRSYLASVERGRRNITLSNVFKLAEALCIAPAELFEGIK